MLTTGYFDALRLLRDEVIQSEYEGYIVSDSIKERIAELHPDADISSETAMEGLFEEMRRLPKDPSFKYVQPNNLEDIRKERPDGPRKMKMKLSEKELSDRLHGAWTGRICGCALGKPVEGWRYEKIKDLLLEQGEWELDNYFKSKEGVTHCPASCRENIEYMEPDDDVHYTLIGLKVLENKGPDFTWEDIPKTWNSSLPYSGICTAETQAILNYNMKTPRNTGGRHSFTTPEFTRRFRNPYREWIGAQIRGDGWAYACAGKPELAAEFAWRDACWTHTANGIYGEMFAAAVIAAAFAESDPHKLIDIGLSEIPANCKLAEAIRESIVFIKKSKNFEDFIKWLYKKYEKMSWVHTVNNALIVVMSLFYGKMNPDKSICISVMGGLDTDCNGATVGSIVGAATGYKNFGGKLAAPLHDTIKPLVFGFQQTTGRELTERTLKVWKTVDEYSKNRLK